MKEKGIVRWFSARKGYGFITCDRTGEDVFVHFNCINVDGFKTLNPGQRVEFTLASGAKGLQATDVVPSDATTITES